jgi:hypothetical protein
MSNMKFQRRKCEMIQVVKPPNEKMKCENCQFCVLTIAQAVRYERTFSERNPECRRFPPVTVMMFDGLEEQESRTSFPSVESDGWCYEFKEKSPDV